jgi:hypothetical protein
MTNASANPTPPDGLSDDIVSDLNHLSPEELRKTIIHAQELLHVREERDPIVEPAPGEDIVSVTEHEGYTEVVKREPCGEDCADCPHGPYLYHVKEQKTPDGGTRTLWTLIGEVYPDDE